jgi:hypothetical protein
LQRLLTLKGILVLVYKQMMARKNLRGQPDQYRCNQQHSD